MITNLFDYKSKKRREEFKVCFDCKKNLPRRQYHLKSHPPGGPQAVCITCRNVRIKRAKENFNAGLMY